MEYDLIFTDYIGLFALKLTQHFYLYKVRPDLLTPVSDIDVDVCFCMCVLLQCRMRILDSFGTEPLCEFIWNFFLIFLYDILHVVSLEMAKCAAKLPVPLPPPPPPPAVPNLSPLPTTLQSHPLDLHTHCLL